MTKSLPFHTQHVLTSERKLFYKALGLTLAGLMYGRKLTRSEFEKEFKEVVRRMCTSPL